MCASLSCTTFCITMSWSRAALSIADWQKTPVMTFKTANITKAMYRKKTTFHTTDSCVRGSSATCQEIPPVIDMKRVDTESPREPQKNFRVVSWASHWSPGRSLIRTSRSMAACAKMMAKTYMISANRTKAQIRDFKVTKMEWISVRNAFSHSMSLASRETRISLLMRSTRITRIADKPDDVRLDGFSSVARMLQLRPRSTKEDTTMKESRHAHLNISLSE
mmetsp:Transcript_105612/g.251779  ORF Transcript_105612/g.251779 Transcript_105612/m.251779 type:complete len:221 (+) Transcript_105612:509-1171(+)